MPDLELVRVQDDRVRGRGDVHVDLDGPGERRSLEEGLEAQTVGRRVDRGGEPVGIADLSHETTDTRPMVLLGTDSMR